MFTQTAFWVFTLNLINIGHSVFNLNFIYYIHRCSIKFGYLCIRRRETLEVRSQIRFFPRELYFSMLCGVRKIKINSYIGMHTHKNKIGCTAVNFNSVVWFTLELNYSKPWVAYKIYMLYIDEHNYELHSGAKRNSNTLPFIAVYLLECNFP